MVKYPHPDNHRQSDEVDQTHLHAARCSTVGFMGKEVDRYLIECHYRQDHRKKGIAHILTVQCKYIPQRQYTEKSDKENQVLHFFLLDEIQCREGECTQELCRGQQFADEYIVFRNVVVRNVDHITRLKPDIGTASL